MATSPLAVQWFRPLLGLAAVGSGVAGLLGLYFVTLPQSNERPLLLGLGMVLQWGSSVVNSEYGSTTTGRKLADKVADAVQTH